MNIYIPDKNETFIVEEEFSFPTARIDPDYPHIKFGQYDYKIILKKGAKLKFKRIIKFNDERYAVFHIYYNKRMRAIYIKPQTLFHVQFSTRS